MGGFGMILGGALKGAGAGLAEGNKSRRQEQLEKLAQDRADARSEREMQFRSTEAATARSFEAGENDKQRAAAADSKVDYVTSDDGRTMAVRGNTATVVKTPDGKDLKIIPKASDTPADIQFMEYLIKNGAAKNVNDAANRLRDIRGNGTEKASLALYKDFLKANIEANVDNPEAAAQKQVDEAISKYGSSDEGAAADPNAVPNDPVHIENATPSGAGTKTAPYRADTQNHVDWFKKFAKPGSVMIIDGTPYTK